MVHFLGDLLQPAIFADDEGIRALFHEKFFVNEISHLLSNKKHLCKNPQIGGVFGKGWLPFDNFFLANTDLIRHAAFARRIVAQCLLAIHAIIALTSIFRCRQQCSRAQSHQIIFQMRSAVTLFTRRDLYHITTPTGAHRPFRCAQVFRIKQL